MVGRPRTVLLQDRLFGRITISGDCWIWAGSKSPEGYGGIAVDGGVRSTHRVAWELTNGKIPEGMCVLHKCDIPSCINPGHLFLGSNKDNAEDRKAKGRNGLMRPYGNKHIEKRGGINAPANK